MLSCYSSGTDSPMTRENLDIGVASVAHLARLPRPIRVRLAGE
jgi:hypothetical protein